MFWREESLQHPLTDSLIIHRIWLNSVLEFGQFSVCFIMSFYETLTLQWLREPNISDRQWICFAAQYGGISSPSESPSRSTRVQTCVKMWFYDLSLQVGANVSTAAAHNLQPHPSSQENASFEIQHTTFTLVHPDQHLFHDRQTNMVRVRFKHYPTYSTTLT